MNPIVHAELSWLVTQRLEARRDRVLVVCVALARQRLQVGLLALLTFHLHLLCDLAGSGPGWPIWYFWPTSLREWFWDGQWELASWQNSVIGLAATLESPPSP